MKVVSLSQFRNRALAAELRELAQLAEEGRISGHAFVVKFGSKDHRAGVSGDYERNPGEALQATVLLERYLANALPSVSERTLS